MRYRITTLNKLTSKKQLIKEYKNILSSNEDTETTWKLMLRASRNYQDNH